jgi:hypothetical protein
MKYAVLVLVVCVSAARAQGIVLESYTGQRPGDVARLLSPFHEELATRGFMTGDTLARRFEGTVSRPAMTKEGLPSDFEDRVERGHKAWIAGRFDEAISTLGPILDAAHASSGAFAQNQPLRAHLLKASIAYALSQQRKGDLAAAKATLGEVLRSFPDTQLSRAQYGPEAFELYEQVRQANAQGGRGRLAIKVSSASTVVFVNERFQNVGSNVDKGDVVPGEYRVYLQEARQLSRVHRAIVKPDQTTDVVIDMGFDTALHTSASYTGFPFASASDRARHEARYAVAFAQAIHASSLIVVGLDLVNGRPAITGALLDLNTGRDIRRASLALDPEPTSERVRSLARFLAGEEPVEGIDVEIPKTVKPSNPVASDEPVAHASNRRWMLWTGVAAIAAGAGGGALAIKFVGDAHDARDERNRVCAVSCTSEQSRTLEERQHRANRNAVISGVAGGLFVATGVVLIVLSRRSSDPPSIALAPATGGALATYAFSF